MFEGGFLGLDNIGPIDRSHLLPGHTLQQSDATAWMAFYSLSMAAIAAILNRHGRDTSDLVVKFLEHFSLISDAMEAQGLWDEEDGFYYDRLRSPDGSTIPVKVASMVGVLPLMAFAVISEEMITRAQTLGKQTARLLARRHLTLDELEGSELLKGEPGNRTALLGVVDEAHLLRILGKLVDEEAFLSPYGLRSVSRWHRDHPYHLQVDGMDASIELRAGGVDDRDVRRQLQLARADLVPGELPDRQRAAPVLALLRRQRDHRVPDRVRPAGARSRRSARTSAAG